MCPEFQRARNCLFVPDMPKPTSVEPMDGQGSATHSNAGEISSTSTSASPRGIAKKNVDEFGYREGN